MTAACMGGWCLKRGHCAHYHATDTSDPAERLCPPGQDGAGFITLQPQEPDDMQKFKLGAEARARILATVREKPTTVKALALMLGAHITNLRSTVARMGSDGDLFTCRARGEGHETHEVWVFADMAERNAFHAACEARTEELQRQYQAQYRERNKALHAERARRARAQAAALKAEVKAREQAARLERAKAEKHAADIRRAEREIAQQKARQEREAAAAEKDRQRKAAKAAQLRLKAETKAAGKLVKLKPANAAPVRVTTPLRPDLPIVVPAGLQIQRAPTPPDRWAVSNPAPVISSSECRAWAKAVTA